MLDWPIGGRHGRPGARLGDAAGTECDGNLNRRRLFQRNSSSFLTDSRCFQGQTRASTPAMFPLPSSYGFAERVRAEHHTHSRERSTAPERVCDHPPQPLRHDVANGMLEFLLVHTLTGGDGCVPYGVLESRQLPGSGPQLRCVTLKVIVQPNLSRGRTAEGNRVQRPTDATTQQSLR